jgi:hypothetical protein
VNGDFKKFLMQDRVCMQETRGKRKNEGKGLSNDDELKW